MPKLCKLTEVMLLRPGCKLCNYHRRANHASAVYLVKNSVTSVTSAMNAPWSLNAAPAQRPGWVTSGSEHELWYQLRDTMPRACWER